VTIEGCRIWLEPLPAAANQFPAGTVPGENAVDTKAGPQFPRATITIRDTEAWGFQHGLISNMAAFNLKENIDAVLDGVTVHDSEIAFRLRGPSALRGPGAQVRIQNAVVHHVGVAFRYEDDVQPVRIWNTTVGAAVTRAFRGANARGSRLDVRNLLLLGGALPAEAAGPSNLAVKPSSFVNTAENDYRLAAGSPAIDQGVALTEVPTDRANVKRPQGAAYDIGAYERPASHPGGRR
jgi:hypothetical protein